ncbi:MAG: phosphoheptose isomerase [Thaumarchaeota archaeon]|nr:MAG: phosphoheptose isomerase [Nitrososphaerota archaeon]
MNRIFEDSIKVISESKKISPDIEKAVELIIKCYKKSCKVVIFGNGGSAADAQHLSAELIGRFQLERQSLPAIALTTDTSILTSLGNDYSFDYIFARQCEALVKKGDVVIAISTSGKSKNVLDGITASKKKGAHIIGLTGSKGILMKKVVDLLLVIPSTSTARIQEGHRVTIHAICELVEKKFKKN